MKNELVRVLRLFTVTAAAAMVMISCQDDLTPTASPKEQAQMAAKDNGQMLIATQEALELTATAMETKGVTQGRVASGDHDDMECAPSVNLTLNVDRTHVDSLIYTGSMSINFGDGSTCESEHKRMGKITDAFKIIVSLKNKTAFTSTETITFEGFSKDSTVYNGVIIVTSANGKPTSVEGQNVAINYEDGTSSSWNGKLTITYQTVGTVSTGSRSGSMSIAGSFNGTTRQGVSYSTVIKESVVFKTGCFGGKHKIPVDGIVEVTTNGELSVLDYGNGECDKTYTVTINGETTTHTSN